MSAKQKIFNELISRAKSGALKPNEAERLKAAAEKMDMSHAARIGDSPSLPGAPSSANIKGFGRVEVGPSSDIIESAKRYSESTKIPLAEVLEYAKVNPDFASGVAKEYSLMAHAPDDPRVMESYKALADETLGQYEQLLSDGVKPFFIKGSDPYSSSPYEALLDLTENKKLGVFPTKRGFGTGDEFDPKGNPLLADSGFTLDGDPVLVNDAFRAVHDYYGHGKGGFGFRAAGEENAYRAHSGMYSDKARAAAASETRGQNSWLNYGPHGETNRTAGIDDTVFADQKTGLLPNWAITQGTGVADARRQRFFESLRGAESSRLGGLQGAIGEDGRIKLTHYSGGPVTRSDPSLYGEGLSGKTIAERNRSHDPDFQKRTSFGILGTDNPYQKERGLGNVVGEVEIPVEQLYDIAGDPDNLRSAIDKNIYRSAQEQATQLEKRIFDKGYSGYLTRDKRLGDVAQVFDPLEFGRKYMVPIGVGILGSSLLPQDAAAWEQAAEAGDVGSISAPTNPRATKLREGAEAYNDYIKNHPLLSVIAPEAPEELLRKIEYGDKRTPSEYFMAALGMM